MKLCFRKKIKDKYSNKVQKLCKSSRISQANKNLIRNLNQKFLKNIIN